MNNKYIYLSYFLDDQTPLYGGSKGIQIKPERSIIAGDTANTKNISFNNHSGTHIDFPNHFFQDGFTSEIYKPSFWIFCRPYLLIKEAIADQIITLSDEEIASIPSETDFLIVKTGFGKHRGEDTYWKNNPGFAPEVADNLRRNFQNLRAIGMDFISLTPYQNRDLGRIAHKAFLGGTKPILLVEDMDVRNLNSQPKSIFCAPLLLKGVDGSPVNIIATI
jgi:kynurenine formamidase